jgi:hypothetical protein
MTNRPLNPSPSTRRFRTAETQPLRPTKVRSMERGLRQLAARGMSARPSGWRLAGARV